VKALYFADQACTLSKDDSRARLVMGRVNWERRLPLAVFYDVETARAGEARLQAEASPPIVEKVLGEALLLEGLARAYLRDVNRAHESLVQAGRHKALTGEAVIQLLIAAGADFPDATLVEHLTDRTRSRKRRELLDDLRASLCSSMDGFDQADGSAAQAGVGLALTSQEQPSPRVHFGVSFTTLPVLKFDASHVGSRPPLVQYTLVLSTTMASGAAWFAASVVTLPPSSDIFITLDTESVQ
jgi:hypothetical protein